MADREKVIRAWEIFRDSNPYEICSGREFRAIREPEYCMGQMIADTIELLKEQDEIIQRVLREKTDELNYKTTTMQIEIQNKEIRKVLEQK